MTTISVTVRNGRIQVDEPVDLPEGTRVTIAIPAKPEDVEDGSTSEPRESIDAWLRWYDALEPVEFTADERSAWDAARQQQKEFEIAEWEAHSKKLEGPFR